MHGYKTTCPPTDSCLDYNYNPVSCPINCTDYYGNAAPCYLDCYDIEGNPEFCPLKPPPSF